MPDAPQEDIQFCLDCQITYDPANPDDSCGCIEPGVPPHIWLQEDEDEGTSKDGGMTLRAEHAPNGSGGCAVFLRGPYPHATKLADLVARLALSCTTDLPGLQREAQRMHEAWEHAHPECRSCGNAFVGPTCPHCHVLSEPRTVIPILA